MSMMMMGVGGGGESVGVTDGTIIAQSNAIASSATPQATFTQGHPAGHLAIGHVLFGNGILISSLTDSSGNTWHVEPVENDWWASFIVWCIPVHPITPGGTLNFTLNAPAGGQIIVAGFNTAGGVLSSGVNGSSSYDRFPSTGVFPYTPPALLIGALAMGGNSNLVPDGTSGFTRVGSASGGPGLSGSLDISLFFKRVTSGTSDGLGADLGVNNEVQWQANWAVAGAS